ncbi:histone-like nucleoid-structuring protein, MvaT/MvaU family [Atopomonas sediminilitoris]|uniref:histone-like nucleoid-structuring protein, MvaT/MvaU family n=1 Tax=Atopomonas sediminilitoris TaxID=2919919 RepID=UPI001F4E9E94|nr:histone-like nucleoid-structuring protein, MvaT/MvaU family [Atopomonas sediminilitoris]MCJ8168675.1 DNA binding protein [Atopomonas sediminilitoris]
MSLLSQYREKKRAAQELQDALRALENDSQLKKEIEFEEKLRGLMGEYNKSLGDVLEILDPKGSASGSRAKASGSKRSRKSKQYKNPHTGEVIETKGGNHKVLKAWKAQYGGDVVESWSTVLG